MQAGLDAHPVSSFGSIAHDVVKGHVGQQAAGAGQECWLGQDSLLPTAQLQNHLLLGKPTQSAAWPPPPRSEVI